MPFPRFLDAGFTIQTGPIINTKNNSPMPMQAKWSDGTDICNLLHLFIGLAYAYLQALAALYSIS